MAYIYMDESGDLGFDFAKKGTSRYFVTTCLITQNKRALERIVRKLFHVFPAKERRRHTGVLHAHKEHPKTLHKALHLLSETDVKIVAIYLDKRHVKAEFQSEKHSLYNHMATAMLRRIFNKKLIQHNEQVWLIASRRETSKHLNAAFRLTLQSEMRNNYKLNILVGIRPPTEDKSLQIIDLVSWSIFRKYEFSDGRYYDIVKSKIVDESSFLR